MHKPKKRRAHSGSCIFVLFLFHTSPHLFKDNSTSSSQSSVCADDDHNPSMIELCHIGPSQIEPSEILRRRSTPIRVSLAFLTFLGLGSVRIFFRAFVPFEREAEELSGAGRLSLLSGTDSSSIAANVSFGDLVAEVVGGRGPEYG